MGYELHITRAEDWGESEQHPITWTEWRDLVEEDPELGFSETDRIGFENQPGEQALVDWLGENKQESCLHWFDGRIESKHPSDALIVKMVEIAERLGGNVQGDDGERYPLEGQLASDRRSGCLAVGLFVAVGIALATSTML